MSELIKPLETLISEVEAGRPAALCTIVRTRGSTPQTPATMIVRSDYQTVGTLGGGCVEAEVRRRAFELLQSGRRGVLDFLLDHDYGWDDGLICGGRMFVGVMSLTLPEQLGPYRAALDDARAGRSATFPVTVEHEGQTQRYRVNIEAPPTLLIAGAGHVGHALAAGRALDFRVIVIDDRADLASQERFGERVELRVGDIEGTLRSYPIDAGCFVVIVTRGHQHDEQALEAVIRSPARYIGLIGSRRKSRLIFDDLRAKGVSQELLDRVHTPIGVDIGAITVPEIAISIAAELVRAPDGAPTLVEGPLEANEE